MTEDLHPRLQYTSTVCRHTGPVSWTRYPYLSDSVKRVFHYQLKIFS